jgi:signal recognition particle subunit SRP54
MASLDTRRPAAQEQLAVLGRQVGVDTLAIVPGEDPLAITKRAMAEARRGGYDSVLLDTAGRQFIDEDLMNETAAVRDIAKPHETLLVADALTGQDAVNLARSFNEKIGITGIVLTRVDGDGRGGAALSMRAVTGRPIKLIGTGEQVNALEEFHPERIASRILGKGDIVSLVERASESMDAAKANKMAQRMKKGAFDLEDLAEQLGQMRKLGGMSGVLNMLPGRRQDQEAAGRRRPRQPGAQAPDGDHRVDDPVRAPQPQGAQCPAQAPHRGGLGHLGAGGQQAAEDACPDVGHDEEDGRSKGGLMGKMFGGGAEPDPAEIERLQAELAGMDPNALPPELRPPQGGPARTLPGLGERRRRPARPRAPPARPRQQPVPGLAPAAGQETAMTDSTRRRPIRPKGDD